MKCALTKSQICVLKQQTARPWPQQRRRRGVPRHGLMDYLFVTEVSTGAPALALRCQSYICFRCWEGVGSVLTHCVEFDQAVSNLKYLIQKWGLLFVAWLCLGKISSCHFLSLSPGDQGFSDTCIETMKLVGVLHLLDSDTLNPRSTVRMHIQEWNTGEFPHNKNRWVAT